MASEGAYRIVHTWAQKLSLWTSTAMVRELLEELEKDRTKDTGIVQIQQILDSRALDWAFERESFLDRIIDEMKRRAWSQALTLGWLPLELPQIERREETTFGREGLRITVSMHCDKKGI